MVELSDTYARLDRDDDVRIIVLTGAGQAFCAGADLSRKGGAFQAPKDVGMFRSSPKRPLAGEILRHEVASSDPL